MVLRHQTLTLLVAAATLVLTIVLYIYIPKGFFPIQDTGRYPGRLGSFGNGLVSGNDPACSRALGKIILKDPAVDSLSSFIGIDGTNTTLNSGRILINLKPIEERGDRRRRRHPALAAGAGPGGRESRCLCSPCRTSRWRTASAARSSSTLSRILTRTSSMPLPHACSRRLQTVSPVARCGERPGGGRAVYTLGLRPQHGLSSRHLPLDHRPNAIRRLRPARSVHDLYAVQPIPRGLGGEPDVS